MPAALLELHGHQVLVAHGGVEALSRALTSRGHPAAHMVKPVVPAKLFWAIES